MDISLSNLVLFQARVNAEIDRLLVVAEQAFRQRFTKPEIVYDLKGSAAGQARIGHGIIRLNRVLMLQNGDAFIKRTPGHELAHLVEFWVYGTHGHGPRWKSIMRIFGLKPERCHSFDTASVKRRSVEYAYQCACKEHKVSATIHNRIRAGRNYTCQNCKSRLKNNNPPIPPPIVSALKVLEGTGDSEFSDSDFPGVHIRI